MDLSALPSAVVQIAYLTIASPNELQKDAWSKGLSTIENSTGYKSLYWGRSVEQPTKVQLHIGKIALN